jgi:hypothetical protein
MNSYHKLTMAQLHETMCASINICNEELSYTDTILKIRLGSAYEVAQQDSEAVHGSEQGVATIAGHLTLIASFA